MKHGWSIEEDDWKMLVQVIDLVHWKSVSLRDLDQESVPSKPGVYAISANLLGINKGNLKEIRNIIYVGKATVSLRQRFLQHCSKPKKELAKAIACINYPLQSIG